MLTVMLFPVIAFSLAVVVGRIGTIIKEDLRKDRTSTDMEYPHAVTD